MNSLFSSSTEAQHFESVRQWIYTHTGLHYPERKYATLYHRLMKLCRQLNLKDLEELNRHLQQRDLPNLAVDLACAVSTNHTFFYREREVFDFFTEEIVPTLPAAEEWRIWSAASSGGDEAYTIALVLSEKLGQEQAQRKARILGTDISLSALEQAEFGVYSERRIEQLSAEQKNRYLQSVGLGQWSVKPGLRAMTTFRRLNLMSEPWPFQNQFHVIFCRNVLYYFDRVDQIRLVERMYDLVTPGGWLITSVTESLRTMPTRWYVLKTGIHRKI